jgi:hypothetical protein
VKKRRLLGVIFLGMALAVPAVAQDQEPAPKPCSAPEHRQFDFWLGEWTVEANGKQAGTNKITAILGGCVLLEEWQSTGGGYGGKSFNRYDPASGQWRQLWLDNQGGVLDLAGTYEEGKMVLQGESISKKGEKAHNRITWTNNAADGTVRQHWERSIDQGKTWKTVFDGLYSKAK